MELTQEIFEKVYNGWDAAANKGIEWKDIEKKKLEEYCQFIVENGIKPMLNDLGIDLPIGQKAHTDYICVLDKEIFSKLMLITFRKKEDYKEYEVFYKKCDEIIEKGVDSKNISPLCTDEKISIESIIPLYNEIMSLPKTPYNNDDYKIFDEIQGYAYKKNQIINKDSAFSELGLHLLCHELMHTIANGTSVNKLRQNIKDLGDEDVNEYFARLASYYLKTSGKANLYENSLGGTTTERMRNSKDKSHDSNGTYGVLIKERKRFDNMTEDRLKEIARFYFMGEEAPENFMIVR